MERTVATFEIHQLHEKLVDSSANLQYKAKMLKANKKLALFFVVFGFFWSQMEKKKEYPSPKRYCILILLEESKLEPLLTV